MMLIFTAWWMKVLEMSTDCPGLGLYPQNRSHANIAPSRMPHWTSKEMIYLDFTRLDLPHKDILLTKLGEFAFPHESPNCLLNTGDQIVC